MFITWVCGNPDFKYKKLLWNNLTDVGRRIMTPWMCIGDFIQIMYPHEKERVRSYSNNQINSFRSFLNDN